MVTSTAISLSDHCGASPFRLGLRSDPNVVPSSTSSNQLSNACPLAIPCRSGRRVIPSSLLRAGKSANDEKFVSFISLSMSAALWPVAR